MQLFVDRLAPNARRVLMFVAEKGLDVSVVDVNVAKREHRSPEFLAMNPFGQVPVLKTSNNVCISESMAICRYLDEVSGAPSLFGSGAEQRARVHMWARHAEFGLFIPAVEYGHHSHPVFRDDFDQIPAYAELNRKRIGETYAVINTRLAASRFLAGEEFSVADVVAYCGMELARLWGTPPDATSVELDRWRHEVYERPSAAVARYA